MASTVKIKRSSIGGKIPTTSDLTTGELAVNTRYGRLFSANSTHVFEIGANVHSAAIGSGGFTIANGAITFPTADGSPNQLLQTDGGGTLSFTTFSGGGNSFNTIAVSGQTSIVADQTLDTLTLVAGNNVVITTDSAADSVTIAAGSDLTDELFADVSDYTSGTTTQLTLANTYGPEVNLWVAFDGVMQFPDQYSLSGTTLTFTSAIPTGTAQVLVKGGAPLTAFPNSLINLNDVHPPSAGNNTHILTYSHANTTFYLSAAGSGTGDVANTYLQANFTANSVVFAHLANTNAYIATKLDSASYTTADVQAKAALANTNAYIATKLDSASYTTADVQAKAALANTNAYIATKLDSSSYTTADVQAKAALANTNSAILQRLEVANNSFINLNDVHPPSAGNNTHVVTYAHANTTFYLAAPAGGGATISSDTSTNTDFLHYFESTTTGTLTALKQDSGYTYNPSTGTTTADHFNNTSDKSLKKDIKILANSIDIINKLEPVSFKWKKNNTPGFGLIAQDVEKILPEIVDENNHGLKSISYIELIPLLINVIKEQQKQINDINSKINA